MTAPYTAVVFTNLRTADDDDGYAAAAVRMEELAAEQPGYLGIESVRDPGGVGITVSYWETHAHALAWKRHTEHLATQQRGRDRWYEWYRVRIATVEREYSYDRGHVSRDEDTAGAVRPAGGDGAWTVNEPDEILHIALPDDWATARSAGEYRVSTRGTSFDDEGFVHCSYLAQLEAVANRFYPDLTELVILHLDPDLLDAEVRVEPAAEGGTELFPHVYGPIPTTAVLATTWWDRGEDGIWHRPVTM